MRLGQKQSESAKLKNSLAHKGRIPWNKGKVGVQIGPNKGKKFSEETKKRLSDSLKGRTVWNKGIPQSDGAKEKNRLAHLGQVAWNRGIPTSKEVVEKMRLSKLGKKMSLECKENHRIANIKRFSNPEERKKQSDNNIKRYTDPEERRKARIMAIEQHRKNGIDFPAVDAGANDVFQYLNMYYDLHIQYPNVEIKDLGYFLDGYDSVANAAYEYDSRRHLIPAVKKKDLIRQKEIIEYYKSINKPLSAFYRINATGVGSKEMINVLDNNKQNVPVGT